jgi:multicomponent Na+:H+ antiporter subunit D
MVTGVLGAVAQYDFRRLLAFHIISQIGYMVMGLALFTPLALAGAMFHIIHNMVVKTNLFLVSGAVERLGGTFDLKKLGGLARTQPGIAGLFFISAMSLAGLPPLSGFFSKFMLVRAGLEQGQWVIVVVSLAVSLLTLFSMVKIWNEAFWKPGQISNVKFQMSKKMVAPIIVMAAVSVAMGLGAESVFGVLMRAAEQMLNPAIYVAAVLGP